MRRRILYVAITLSDGVIALYLGTLAFMFPVLAFFADDWWATQSLHEALEIAGGILSNPFKFKELGIPSLMGGALCAPLLVNWLEHYQTTSVYRFILFSALVGIAYGLISAGATSGFFSLIGILAGDPIKEMNLAWLIITLLTGVWMGTISGMMVSVFLYIHIILIGGAIVGVLNGLIVRSFLHQSKTSIPENPTP